MPDATASRSLARRLRQIPEVGEVLDRAGDLFAYESDALTLLHARPALVVLPTSAQAVRDIVAACNDASTAYVARGAGTGLSGGATPVEGCVLIELSGLNGRKRMPQYSTVSVLQY